MLDLEQEANQRTHHVVQSTAAMSRETVVVSKVKHLDRSPRAVLRHACRWTVREKSSGGVRTILFSPPLNYPQALASGVAEGRAGVRGRPHRRWLAATLSACGIARDAVLAPAFVATALARTRGRFDLCIADNPFSACAALTLRALGRVGRVVYEDMDYVAGGQALGVRIAYTAALERWAVRRADLTVSAGWMLGAHRLKTTGREVLVIPNGVDTARFACERGGRRRRSTLVYVGHLARYCAVDVAIEALPAIRAAIPDAKLVVLGDGDAPYVQSAKRRAAALGQADAVQFRGRVPYAAVPAALAEADIGFAVSRDTLQRRYAFPLKMVEYMAAGLPVICTAGSEAAALLERYPAGRAVACTSDSIADAAVELLRDDQAYRAAQEAAEAAARAHTWDHAMRQQRCAIARLMGRGDAPAAAGA